MFTIDLLKGQGIPARSKPESIAITAVIFLVPAFVVVAMVGIYTSRNVSITIQRQRIAGYEEKLASDKLSEAIKLKQSFEQERKVINNSLSEVASCVGGYKQWSDILVTLAENMPRSMVMSKLEINENNEKRTVPQKDDPRKMVEITVPVTVLHMSICGNSDGNYDKAVRNFRDSLRVSDSLSSRLKDIKVAHEPGSYEIYLVFKPQS